MMDILANQFDKFFKTVINFCYISIFICKQKRRKRKPLTAF